MELNDERLSRLVGLSPSKDYAGVSRSSIARSQQQSHITTRVADHALEAQLQPSVLRGVILQVLSRQDRVPGGRGLLCVERTSSQDGLNRVRYSQGGLHGRSDA